MISFLCLYCTSAPAFYVSSQPLLSLYSNGRITGVVVETGDEVTHAVPIIEGCILPKATCKLNVAGKALTNYLKDIITERGYLFTANEKDTVGDIKEKLGYVALAFDKEMQTPAKKFEKTYELPDGQIITIGNERFRCAEPLFQPHLVNIHDPGIHQLVYDALTLCNDDIREELYANIVLSGGIFK